MTPSPPPPPRSRLAEKVGALFVAATLAFVVVLPASCLTYRWKTNRALCDAWLPHWHEALLEGTAVTMALLWARNQGP